MGSSIRAANSESLSLRTPLSVADSSPEIRSAEHFDANDRRRILPRFSAENLPKNLEIVDRMEELASKKNCSVGQLTLAWLRSIGETVIPIPGTTKNRNLEENVGSLDVGLSPKDLEDINEVIQAADVQGDHHPRSMMPYVYVDTVPLEE
ncbi:hypothetical protein ASPWEDRAFT_177601 [Aspergillus wentii DTO 134E9]|uniref:NADP-dependent oxidoreductase domain-containing protein n=1 Tax=Aspergillus wentii DTO 134E9 TaxID=1073089 RepID=A0A1L9R4Q5_ASPWE|nr:uncharacterized protein ASPWEDRAFT_177601 [Aspergillus wentii DTO 134E9]OJJ29867.1 hypothetical protein ASPWEDRAFT_177601 [Aspergillus wentii DTO 134E9]